MALHKELFNDLPAAEEIMNKNENFFKNIKNADGYYELIQRISAKYGDKAYDLAEKVFDELGMEYDHKELRTSGKVRKVDYMFEGINVYDITVKEYDKDMIKDLIWLYNREIRKISREYLIDEAYFTSNITDVSVKNNEGLFVAYNQAGKRTGYIHCIINNDGSGCCDALFFLPGDIHLPTANSLVKRAEEFFKLKGAKKIDILKGNIKYPFYAGSADKAITEIKNKLPHIYKVLEELQTSQV